MLSVRLAAFVFVVLSSALYSDSSCEPGQEVVRLARVKKLIIAARNQFPGEFDILRQCRRLELALEDDGWRGNVETIIDKEFYNIDTKESLQTISVILGGDISTFKGNDSKTGIDTERSSSRRRGNTAAKGRTKHEINEMSTIDIFEHMDDDEGKHNHTHTHRKAEAKEYIEGSTNFSKSVVSAFSDNLDA